jgi:hypothetical protein
LANVIGIFISCIIVWATTLAAMEGFIK